MIKNTTSETIAGIPLGSDSKEIILEKIKKYIESPKGFFHIVSVNPENIVLAHERPDFKKVVETAQILLNDGVGVIIAGRILGFSHKDRITGVDLMKELIEMSSRMRSRVLLIGGSPNLAKSMAECYSQSFPEAKFWGIEGIADVKNPRESELEEIRSIVTARRPHFIFTAFGSPRQELWLYENRETFEGAICMGVGGAFDYLSGSIQRPNPIIQLLGFEWLYRLIIQPWRWRRQLRLVQFIGLVLKQKLSRG